MLTPLPAPNPNTNMNSMWFRLLPAFVRNKLDGRHGLQAVLGNSSWLFADKILRMVVGLLVGVWIVRYLGPTQLGLLSYSGSFAGLFGALATLGLDSIVIRELVRHPQRQGELLGTAFALKVAGGVAALAASVIGILLARGGDEQMLVLVVLAAAVFIFQPLNVIDFYFQSKVQSRYTVYATTSAFLLLTLVKIVLLVVKAPLVAFAWAALAEIALSMAFLAVAYLVQKQSLRVWRFDGKLARELLSQSWPLILSSVAIIIYMRIDQIMIGQMLGDKEVGLFAAAIRISEMWYFVPAALVSSMFPTIVGSKKLGERIYYERLQRFFTALLWLAISVAVIVTLGRNLIVEILYGATYAGSANVLAIHIWAGVFMVLGIASGSWYVVEGLQKYTFYRNLLGAFINVLLNFVLIPRYGIEGSALATVMAQAGAAFLFDSTNRKTRPIFWLKVKAFNPMSMLSSRS